MLFWGLRDLKRIHLLTVDKPRVDIECSGHILCSSIIQNARKNPNFTNAVKFLELDLPEQELYRPPLTIRAVDCRSFGRYTLVGTHMINSIHKYMYNPLTKREREAEERRKFNQLNTNEHSPLLQQHSPILNPDSDNSKEKSPLLPKDFSISVTYGGTQQTNKTKTDTATSKKRKPSFDEEEDDEEGSKDWWTKYFASIERMIDDSKEAKKLQNQQNGNLQVFVDEDGGQDDKSPGESGKKRFGFKTAATASRFAAKISPKSVRKRTKYKPALCKVSFTSINYLSYCSCVRYSLQNLKLHLSLKNLKNGFILLNCIEAKRLEKKVKMIVVL